MIEHRIMTKAERNIFSQFCGVKESSVLSAMQTFLVQKGYKNVEKTPFWLMAEGDIPVAVVAHADTVFKDLPCEIYYDTEKNVMWSPQGLGADDRAGVFAIFKLINEYHVKPHVIITTGEESGCIGSSKLIGKYENAPWSLKFMIQLDRRGEEDSVFYDCANYDFEDWVNNFGFKTNYGSFTDISIIAPTWGVAAVNFSVGYISEHSATERLFVDHLFNTIDKTANILTYVQSHGDVPNFEYKESPSTMWAADYPTDWDDDYAYGWYHGYPSKKHKTYKCDKCAHTGLERNDTLPVYFQTQKGFSRKNICLSCFYKDSDKIEYCHVCNEAWLPKDKLPIDKSGKNYLCPICELKAKGANVAIL